MAVGFLKKGLRWLSILPLGGGTIALTTWLVHANKPLSRVEGIGAESKNEEKPEAPTPPEPPEDSEEDEEDEEEDGEISEELPSGDEEGKGKDKKKGTKTTKKEKGDKEKLTEALKGISKLNTDNISEDIFGAFSASLELKDAEESIKKLQEKKSEE